MRGCGTFLFAVGMALWTSPVVAEGTKVETDKPALAATADVQPTSDLTSNLAWSRWVGHLFEAAKERGVSEELFNAAFAGVEPNAQILERLENQPEFTRTTGDYISKAVSDRRIALGREQLVTHADLLSRIEKTYGVDRHVVVAIWGLESTYGTGKGERDVIRSLATLAYDGGRRISFGRRQLFAALEILRNGDVPVADLKGSWAGAMGHTQFIPTTYLSFAVDFDNDGRRDIWNSVPDALASTAYYLTKSGWKSGVRWGAEVRLPDGFDYALTGRRVVAPWSDWKDKKVTLVDGELDAALGQSGSILLPSGVKGPAFFVTPSFGAILRYNFSTSYALAIGHLADRLAGAKPFVQAWPVDDKPLNLAGRKRLQHVLVDLGYDTGGIDGILGTKSRAAIRAFQTKAGIIPDGHPNEALLQLLETSK